MSDVTTGFSTIATVDLGSNSFHMIVAQVDNGGIRIQDRLREMVRLADGLDSYHTLDAAARERAFACLGRFGQRLRDLLPGSVRAVGTNTLRRARDPGFLVEATALLGHPVEVISGVEEARLIYLGVAHSLPMSEEQRLVVDIGGGSTECIIGHGFETQRKESLYMGCVSYSNHFFVGGKITAKRMQRALIAARLELQTIATTYRRIGWGQVVGASGTIKAVGSVVEAMGWSESGITRQSLHQFVAALIDAGAVDTVQLAGLKDERRPVLAGGVAVLLSIFEAFDIEHMAVSDWALREGVLFDLVGRIRDEDVRERTANSLLARYHIDSEQARRVEATACDALNQVAEKWRCGDPDSEALLRWAARLHEIGIAITYSQYQKHGAYLLENADMPGFSRNEQRVLAALVRSHRRKFPSAVFRELPDGIRIRNLAILLRIAVLLHRSRSESPLPSIRFRASGDSLESIFPYGWLDEHPLTQADLEQEVELLQADGFKLLFS